MRALVTGGAGFIGSHVVDALLARGDEVHVFDNLSTGKREHVAERATFHEADIRADADDVFAEARPEVCFHLAAHADVPSSVERPVYDAEVNVLGTVRLLEAAREHGTQLVFTSTGGALYGECEVPAREDIPRHPLSPYGVSKLCGEEYLATWNRLHGTKHVTLRFGNVYGPRQDSSLEGGVVAIFLERMARDEATQIFGDGGHTRDYVYVGDVVEGVLAAAGHEGGTFNIASGVGTTVAELHAACRRASRSERAPEHAPPRPGDLLRSLIDPGLAERELGWRARHSLEEGLQLTWEWTAAQPR